MADHPLRPATDRSLGEPFDTRLEAATSAKDFAALPTATDALDKAARDLRLVFKKEERLPATATGNFKEWQPALDTLSDKLTHLNSLLEKQAERSEGLENCWQRGLALALQLKQWVGEKPPVEGLASD